MLASVNRVNYLNGCRGVRTIVRVRCVQQSIRRGVVAARSAAPSVEGLQEAQAQPAPDNNQPTVQAIKPNTNQASTEDRRGDAANTKTRSRSKKTGSGPMVTLSYASAGSFRWKVQEQELLWAAAPQPLRLRATGELRSQDSSALKASVAAGPFTHIQYSPMPTGSEASVLEAAKKVASTIGRTVVSLKQFKRDGQAGASVLLASKDAGRDALLAAATVQVSVVLQQQQQQQGKAGSRAGSSKQGQDEQAGQQAEGEGKTKKKGLKRTSWGDFAFSQEDMERLWSAASYTYRVHADRDSYDEAATQERLTSLLAQYPFVSVVRTPSGVAAVKDLVAAVGATVLCSRGEQRRQYLLTKGSKSKEELLALAASEAPVVAERLKAREAQLAAERASRQAAEAGGEAQDGASAAEAAKGAAPAAAAAAAAGAAGAAVEAGAATAPSAAQSS